MKNLTNQFNPVGRLYFLIIVFLVFSNLLHAQNRILFGGVNHNIYYDHDPSEVHYYSEYKTGIGYSIGYGWDEFKKFKAGYFAFQLDYYTGQIYASNGANGGGYYVDAQVNKSILSLCFFPVKARIAKAWEINLGAVTSVLLTDKLDGNFTTWQFGQPQKDYDLETYYSKYSATVYFGIEARFAYSIHLSERIDLVPQYMFYYGLTNEFIKFPKITKAMRNYLCVGIKWKSQNSNAATRRPGNNG